MSHNDMPEAPPLPPEAPPLPPEAPQASPAAAAAPAFNPNAPASSLVTGQAATTKGWGSGTASEQIRSSSKFVLQRAPAFPCLDVMYPGKFRFHCQKCTDDAVISKFTRHKFYMFYGYTEQNGEKLYRMPQAQANNYVEGCARGKYKPGAFIRATETGVALAGPSLDAKDLEMQEHSDDVAEICKKIVLEQYELFVDGTEAYVLQSQRVPPYLVVVHENASPSTVDIIAFEQGYTKEFLEKLDAEYEESLRKSFRR